MESNWYLSELGLRSDHLAADLSQNRALQSSRGSKPLDCKRVFDLRHLGLREGKEIVRAERFKQVGLELFAIANLPVCVRIFRAANLEPF